MIQQKHCSRIPASLSNILFGLVICALTCLGATGAHGQDAKSKAEWPQFLGPQRNGISTETGLLTSWPEGGPAVVWRVPGGTGMSGLAISRGRVITMIHRDGQQQVVALDALTGKPIWNTPVAPEYKNGMGNGPRGTPAIAGDLVFVFTGEGILAALKFADGKLAWSQNVVKALEGEVADYGMACSPLVVGKLVIVTPGAPDAGVIAYDLTGKMVWMSATDGDAAGYSSPALLELAGQPQVVAFTGGGVQGLVPESGKVLWRYPFETNYNCNIVTPLSIDGRVFISAGENHGSALLELKANCDQSFTAKEVWTSLGPKSVLRNEWQTSILHDGHLYGFDNVGAAGPITHLTCINARTGERAWQQIRFGKGNHLAADGKLFISTMNGELVVVKLNPKAYEEMGRVELLGSTRQAPALAGGRLYLRDDKEIVCVDVRKK